MKSIARLFAILILPLALTSCFLVPGAFVSSLDLRKDGNFTFAYKGEILFQAPDDIMNDGKRPAWSDDNASCYGPEPGAKPEDGDETPSDASRPCTKAELAEKKAEWEVEQKASIERKAKEGQQFATLFGFSPTDDESNRKFAASLMRYDGWKSVVYKGKGVFDVDYRITAKMGYDYIFPLFPQGDFIIPFVQIRKRDQGSVIVNAPALIGGGMRALATRAKAMGAPDTKDMPQSTRTRGTFTVTTDGEILTNNTDNGPAKVPTGRSLSWSIDPTTEKVPETLIRLQ